MFKNLIIATKSLFLISILVILFFIISTYLVSNQNIKQTSLRELQNTITLATLISKVLHETQRERGFTSGFLANEGKLFEDELLNQRELTDKKIKLLKNFSLATENPRIKTSFQETLTSVQELNEIRKDIDSLSLSVLDAIEIYSQMNEKFLYLIAGVSETSSTAVIAQKIISYSNLLYVKENSGIERALGASILSDKSFVAQQRVKFIKLVAMQELYTQNFLNHTTNEGRAFYKKIFQGEAIEISNNIRDAILINIGENFSASPKYWVENITIKINKLKLVEEYLEDDIFDNISNELNLTYKLHTIFAFINIVSIIIMIIMIHIAIKIIRNEKRLRILSDKYIINSRTDANGKITYASEAFCNISGYTREELIGKSHNIVRHPDMPKSSFKEMWSTIKKGYIWTGRVKNRKKDGSHYWVYVNIEPLFNANGDIESYMAIRLDITESYRLEEKVKDELEKSREKDKMMLQQSKLAQMGEMISMIAHQWRQPLAAISSISTGMNIKTRLDNLDKETILKLTNDIIEHSQHLSHTIDDFREFFKPNKEKSNTNFTEIIQNVLSIVETSITTKNIQIIQEFECDSSFNTYPNELKQVVLNLLKNAEDALLENEIKNPFIKIKTYTEDESCILEVSDNAGGIPEDIVDNIFDPYFSTKTKKDGTGLGLYMSKTIIEEHCGGLLHVSNSETGAVFKIVLREDNV